MRLDDGVKKRIAQELGRDVPPPSDESFWDLVEELRATRPELATELEENVIFDDLGDPERKAQKANARAVAARMFYRKLFFRFDEVRQKWHLHRGKLMGWGVLAFMAFFLPTFYLRPAPTTAVAAGVAVNAMSGGSMSGGVADAPELPKPRKLPRPEPLVVEQPRETEAPQATPLVTNAAPTVPPTQPQIPTTTEPGSLRAYSKQEAANTEVRGLNAYNRNGQIAGAPQGGGSDPFADPSSTVQTSGLSAFQKPQADAASTEPKGLSAYAKESQLSTLRSPDDPNPQAPSAQASGGSAPLFRGETMGPEYTEVSALGTQPADPFAAPPPPAQASGFEDPAAAELTSATEQYKPGDTVEGELVVGLTALGEESLPVIARGRDGSVWRGQAVLSASGRVDITFSNAAGEHGDQSLEAIALADDGYAGVPAAIKETTPALASDLARGALRGASEFVEGLRDQSSVTLSNGAAVVNQTVPPLDASVLGSVARLFTPPEGEDQQALVRLAEVPVGTKFQIMVLSPAQADPQTP